MKNLHTYLEYITFRFENNLKKDSLFGLIKNTKPYHYHLKDIHDCSFSEQQQQLSTVDDFFKDLKSHFVNNTPLHFIYNNNENIYYHFSSSIMRHIVHEDFFDEESFTVIPPTVKELLKVGNLFKEGTIRVDSVFDVIPKGVDINGQEYQDFILFLMSIPNKHLFDNNQISVNVINSEFCAFTNMFKSETNPKIKDAFKVYLENRKEFIEKIDSKSLEESLLIRIKKSFAPKYWSEFIFAFPNLQEQNKGISKDNLIEFDQENIYHLNLNKGALYKFCPSILNEQDLIQIIASVTQAINDNKPQEISMIQFHCMPNDIKIIFSGSVDSSYLNKVGNLYQLMLDEYNSENIIKFTKDKEEFELALINNTEYLDKASKKNWLSVMLEPTNDNKKKKLKL